MPPVNPLDQRNTDRYYRSAEVSTIGGSRGPMDTGVPGTGEAPAGVRRLSPLDERNTDRYYAIHTVATKAPVKGEPMTQPNQAASSNQATVANAGRRAVGGACPIPQGSSIQPVQHAQATHALCVQNVSEVNSVVAAACRQLNAGQQRVIIRITGDPSLAMQVRTRLDFCLTHQEISEEQYYNVRILTSAEATSRNAQAINERFGAPQPAGDKKADEPVTADPAEVLVTEAAPEAAATETEDNDFLGEKLPKTSE